MKRDDGLAGMAAITHEMERRFELLKQRSGGLSRDAIDCLHWRQCWPAPVGRGRRERHEPCRGDRARALTSASRA